jgi:hypothetical protein
VSGRCHFLVKEMSARARSALIPMELGETDSSACVVAAEGDRAFSDIKHCQFMPEGNLKG